MCWLPKSEFSGCHPAGIPQPEVNVPEDEIKAELASMEHQGVIEKVQEGQPTDWVNSIVYQ